MFAYIYGSNFDESKIGLKIVMGEFCLHILKENSPHLMNDKDVVTLI